MTTFFGIIIGLIILNIIVVVHELGHYFAAKRAGVIVEEFGIGFPPNAWKKTLKNGVVLAINWLPIGGYCKMKEHEGKGSKKGTYDGATFWQKTQILFSGVILNWLLAVLIFTGLAFTGLPQALPNQFRVDSDTTEIHSPVMITSVTEDSPAYISGLKVGDEILRIGDRPIIRSSDVATVARDLAGQTVQIEYTRDKTTSSRKVTLREHNDDNRGFLGVSSFQSTVTRSTWSAPIVGIGVTAQFTAETVIGVTRTIGDFFGGLLMQLSPNSATRESGQQSIGAAGESVAGPIGILGVIFPQAAQSGLTTLAFLAAIISLSLAVMNLLPIPALDGGRWLLSAIFKLFRKPLTKEFEEKVNTIGFLSLMALILLITIVDVTRFF